MPVLPILEHPADILRQPSEPVAAFDAALEDLVGDLIDTLHHYGGIGLSAPQTGRLQQVLLVHIPDDDYGLQVYINPQLIWTATPGLVQESCLSVPGIVGNVFRATRLRVSACDAHGNAFEREVDGMHAVCLQHEMDHLAGKLFIDRLSWFRRLRIRLAASKAQRQDEAGRTAGASGG